MVPYLFSASSILLIPPAPTTSRNPPNHRFLPTLSPIPPYLFPSPRLGALCSLPASLFLLSLFVFLFAFTQVMYVKSTIRVPVLIPRLPLLWSLFWWLFVVVVFVVVIVVVVISLVAFAVVVVVVLSVRHVCDCESVCV